MAHPSDFPESNDRFHSGELFMQDLYGVRARQEQMASYLLHREMTQEHRWFYCRLPYVFIASVDVDGQPWASVMSHPEGVVQAPAPDTLILRCSGEHTLPEGISPGTALGVLGLDLELRHRMRLHGQVQAVTKDSITLKVKQSYPNCPKYINARTIQVANATPPEEIVVGGSLDSESRALINAADTLFIASYYSDGTDADYDGADVNLRSGPKGFVKVADQGKLIIPDYSGNYLFNTIGNLLQNPRAGLLFVDFDSGTQLQVLGRAEVQLEGIEIAEYPEAVRLIHVMVERTRLKRWGPDTRAPLTGNYI